MFKFRNGLLPDIFNNFFVANNAAHRYPTRTGSQLRMPLARTMIASSFITKTGVTIWNNIETHITGNLKIGTFKSKLKKFITLAYAPWLPYLTIWMCLLLWPTSLMLKELMVYVTPYVDWIIPSPNCSHVRPSITESVLSNINMRELMVHVAP